MLEKFQITGCQHVPLLAEELLAIDGHWGKESIAFRVVSPERMLKL